MPDRARGVSRPSSQLNWAGTHFGLLVSVAGGIQWFETELADLEAQQRWLDADRSRCMRTILDTDNEGRDWWENGLMGVVGQETEKVGDRKVGARRVVGGQFGFWWGWFDGRGEGGGRRAGAALSTPCPTSQAPRWALSWKIFLFGLLPTSIVTWVNSIVTYLSDLTE